MTRYKIHVDEYYRRADGTPTGEAATIGHALRPLRKMYGNLPAAEFSPLKLKAVREAMIDPKILDAQATATGWCRRLINRSVSRIRAMFKWGVENELLSPSVYHGLLAVSALKSGRSEARESLPIFPVDESIVDATLAYLTPTVAAMVRLQRLTGARPGEIASLRTADIDTSGDIWIYKPAQHKTAHHGRHRAISIGPRAQLVLKPLLKPLNPAAYIFNPADSMAEMRERRHAARKTPHGQGNGIGTNRIRSPRRSTGERYNAASLRKAIARATGHTCRREKSILQWF